MVTDRLSFNGWADDWFELSDPVDVVVTETIGNVGFDEGLLAWMKDAQQRLLADDGRYVPQKLQIVAVPIGSEENYHYVEGWQWPFFGLDS